MIRISSIRKFIVVIPGALVMYLIQTCVMTYLPVGGVYGSVILAYLGVVIVSCGRKGAFCASSMMGILCEAMLSNLPGLYIICYPVLTMLLAQGLADQSERQLERRSLTRPDKRHVQMRPIVRIALSVIFLSLSFQVIYLAYGYLNGVELTAGHIGRALGQTLYTLVLALPVGVLVRAVLGMYKRAPKPKGATA